MCDFYLSNDAFGRLSRKYLARTVDPKWQIQVRWAIMRRQGDLIAKQSRQRHLKSISQLLEDDKYKTVAHGQVSYIALLGDKVIEEDKPEKGKLCLELFTKQVDFITECGLIHKRKGIELERSIFAEVYKKEAEELKLDLGLSNYFSTAKEIIQQCLDEKVPINMVLRDSVAHSYQRLLMSSQGLT